MVQDSAATITTWENAEWGPLLLHNLSDTQRTFEPAQVAERFPQGGKAARGNPRN